MCDASRYWSKNQRLGEKYLFGAVSLLSSRAPRVLYPRSTLRPHGGIPALERALMRPPPIGAEFFPEILAELPDSTELSFDDPEASGIYVAACSGSMRVPDIPVPDWNKMSPAHTIIQQGLYLQRCEQRRKDKI